MEDIRTVEKLDEDIGELVRQCRAIQIATIKVGRPADKKVVYAFCYGGRIALELTQESKKLEQVIINTDIVLKTKLSSRIILELREFGIKLSIEDVTYLLMSTVYQIGGLACEALNTRMRGIRV